VLRVSLGSLALDKTLSRGQYRQLTDEEIGALLKLPAAEPVESQ
jgi:16S rRNA U516 pseudouridylate synthase RsuA-like enzyme